MKKILILGGTGKLGNVLTKALVEKGYKVNLLVRNPEKLESKNDKLNIFVGQVTNINDLAKAIDGVDLVISVLGHGFRTSFPIQENTMRILVPLMEKKNIDRLITITGAALKTRDDPDSLILTISNLVFKIIDPYRMRDAEKQQELLEKCNLDWTVIRTPIHKSSSISKISHTGYKQPLPWKRISRKSVSYFIIDLIENDKWIKKSPIIY